MAALIRGGRTPQQARDTIEEMTEIEVLAIGVRERMAAGLRPLKVEDDTEESELLKAKLAKKYERDMRKSNARR